MASSSDPINQLAAVVQNMQQKLQAFWPDAGDLDALGNTGYKGKEGRRCTRFWWQRYRRKGAKWEKKKMNHLAHPYRSPTLKLVGRVRWRYLDQVLAGCGRQNGFERLFGKKIPEEHLEFGEVVLWRKPQQCGCGSLLGVWSLGRTEVGHTSPSGVSWQPCRRVQGHPARATG